MQKLTITIVLFFFLVQAKGQGSGISIAGGIGTYDLAALKSYQELLISRLPVEARGFNSFPPFTSVRMNLFRQHTAKFTYGLVYAFSTTGTMANYTDYSGYLNLDQVVSAYQFGFSASYRLLYMELGASRLDLSAYGDLRLGYVRDEVSLSINTRYYFENNRLVLNTISPMAEAGVNAMMHFNKISLGLEGGLLYDTGSKLSAGNASDPTSGISLSPPSDVQSGMSGMRGGIKLILWFNNELTEE